MGKVKSKPRNEIDDIFSFGKKRQAEDSQSDKEAIPNQSSSINSSLKDQNAKKQTVTKKDSNKANSKGIAKQSKSAHIQAESISLIDGLFSRQSQSSNSKTTEEGYRIISAEELIEQNRNAGNSKDCPFDCQCCF